MKNIKAVYLYLSTCCNVRAEKPACVKPEKGSKDFTPLGTWHCGRCGRACSVKRTKEEE